MTDVDQTVPDIFRETVISYAAPYLPVDMVRIEADAGRRGRCSNHPYLDVARAVELPPDGAECDHCYHNPRQRRRLWAT